MSNIAIINDNNNFAPSTFRSLCELVGDCFGPWYIATKTLLGMGGIIPEYYIETLIRPKDTLSKN